MPAFLKTSAVPVSLVLAGCAAPIDKPLPPAATVPITVTAAVTDLRSTEWKATKVLANGQGVVQHLGDNSFPGGSLPAYLAQRLAPSLTAAQAKTMSIKTVDVRLSIPDAKIDQAQLDTAVAMQGLIAVPIVGLFSAATRNMTASAVICVNIDGKDFVGNDARLFRFGPEGELRDSIDAAIALLAKNIAARAASTSVACEPGWEGGQPRAK